MRKLEEFWFRYFSQATEYTKDNWLRMTVAGVMLLTTLLGVIFDTFGYPRLAKVSFLLFSLEMIIFALLWITVFFYHNWRIKHESK
jgi:uncharacterized membrane protein YesL